MAVDVPPNRPDWTAWHTLALAADLAGVLAAGVLARGAYRAAGWVVSLALLAGFSAVVGRGGTGLWRGALLDPRNRLSLSRLQALVWTILILSALSTATLSNVAGGQPEPLAVAVPNEVWFLMGIGTTSLAATPLIRSTKESRPANDEERTRTLDLLAARRGVGQPEQTVGSVGQVVVNVRPADAQWADLFMGEEVGDAPYLDIGKVQLVYVTAVLALIYTAALFRLFLSPDERIARLPALNDGLLALLGISHAGYLAVKAAPKSRPA